MNKFVNLMVRLFDLEAPVLDGLVAENWAAKSIVTLSNDCPMIFAVNRDFEDQFTKAGEVVNVSKIGKMVARRKARMGKYQSDKSQSESIPVVMDQHLYSRTYLGKRDLTASFADLFSKFGQPCMKSLVQQLEEIIIGKTLKTCVTNRGVGKLGVAFSTDAAASINERFRVANAGSYMRYAFINAQAETQLLLQKLVTEASARGDGGNALENATIGKIFNTWFIPSSNMPVIVNSNDISGTVTSGTVTSTATESSVDVTFATAPTAGGWMVFADEGAPHLIKTVTSAGTGSDDYTVVVQPAIAADVTLTAAHAVKATIPGAVAALTIDGTAYSTYPIGWTEEVGVTFAGNVPSPCQMISVGNTLSFGSDGLPSNVYGALSTDTDAQATDRVLLSCNLKAALTAGDVIGKGPAGGYGIAMCPEAVTLVNRPLAVLPGDQNEAYASDSGISLNVSVDRNVDYGGYTVTFETLIGVTVTNKDLVYPIFN